MTEVEWLASPDALSMLRFLGKKVSGRKLRLFAVACVKRRRIWDLLGDERSRKAVELAQRYADRQVTRKELRDAEQKARAAAHAIFAVSGDKYAALAATEAAAYTSPRAAYEAAYFAESVNGSGAERSQIRASHAHLLRDVFANPFRPVPVDPAWLAWDGGTVRQLAQAIYDERAFERMPVLADALEEAGCTNADILDHCRQPAEHVRGCWVVDLLLGRT